MEVRGKKRKWRKWKMQEKTKSKRGVWTETFKSVMVLGS